MPEPAPPPTAKRLQRPSWRDSRLVVGILLVVVAAALGAKAVAGADDRVPMWVAATNLVAGDRVEAGSFARADVGLADGMDLYLGAASPPPVGSVVVRDLRAGEIVPSSALGAPDAVQVQRVTVRSDSLGTAGLTRGSRVDVFVTPKPRDGSAAGTTTKLLRSVAVAAVVTGGSGFGSNATSSVQVYVPSEKVQAVVEAVDSDAKITLVPAVGALASGAS